MQSSILKSTSCIKIQKWYRGNILRHKRLPLILYNVQKFLKYSNIKMSMQMTDGRINSNIDEDTIINKLVLQYKKKIQVPKIRMWYDILLFDNKCGWIPVNIKSTTTLTSDNTANLAMCVYAYTNAKLDLYKAYNNGQMSVILADKLKKKEYNKIRKKDYYFLVINKRTPTDIIINSVKGLSLLVSNSNNLPFQICWNKNRDFKYNHIENVVDKFLVCINKTKPSWKDTFIKKIKEIK